MYAKKLSSDELMHYGTPRHSGRYPWGSGDNPNQHTGDIISRVEDLKAKGITNESEIAAALGILNEKGQPSTGRLRAQLGVAKDQRRADMVARVKSLEADGLGPTEIGKQLGLPESTVRSLQNERSAARMNQAKVTADFLREQVNTKGMIDVGVGVERELGVSREKLNQALYILEMEGYTTYGGGVPQITNPGKQTNIKVLCPPGTEHKEIYNFDNVHSVRDYVSKDMGDSFEPRFVYPKSMDSSRLAIRYAEDGGINKDGVIEIRRGVKDLDLGGSHYSQVRILVDGDRYLKGMAVYSDNLPDGVDIVFNTNKSKNVPKMEVLKKIKDDPDNPFGSLIKSQSYYIDDNGKKQLSLINKRADEGDWGDWADKLPSQFLAKQNVNLVKKQLGISMDDKKMEFDEIKSLTNPTVKKAMLKTFADECDAAAIDLQAAALPRQKYQVLLPLTKIKDNEIYAPNYKDGEQVALVRYPHGGTFEIPILTVNNKITEGKKLMGTNPLDAVGISSKVAERLSGADFDGDTAMVIPTGKHVKISSTPPLKGLEGFDPKLEYGGKPEGTFKPMKNTQKEMGVVSNLITDMTIKGASQDELARAVRHSMVVIDAEKHKLDYKQSEADNGIAALKKKYQGHYDDDGTYHEGASTILSKSKSQQSVLKRQGSPTINPDGSLSWKTADDLEYYDKKTGKTKIRTQQSTKMAEAKDALDLVSSTTMVNGKRVATHPVEQAYADYANFMKNLANESRKEMINTGKIAINASAKTTYAAEVASLDHKLGIALSNAPRERQAQTMANSIVAAKRRDNPDMTKKEIKKAGQQALEASRAKVGAKRQAIDITDREWEAIQAGAISETKLIKIINNTDTDKLKQRATPRSSTELSQAKINKIASMKANGYTTAQIAQAIGASTSTVTKYLK